MDLGNIPIRTKRPLEGQTLSTSSHTTGYAALTTRSKRNVEAHTPSTPSSGKTTSVALTIHSKRPLDKSKDNQKSLSISPLPAQGRTLKRVRVPDDPPPAQNVATRRRKKPNRRPRNIWSSAPGINPFIQPRDTCAPSPEPTAQTAKNHNDKYTREEMNELTKCLSNGPAPSMARQLSFWHRILSIEDAAPYRAQQGFPYRSPGSYVPSLKTPVQTTQTRDNTHETRDGPQSFSWIAFTSPVPNNEPIREHHELPDDEYRLSHMQRESMFQTADSHPPEYECTTATQARSMRSPGENAVERKQLRDLDWLFDEQVTPASVKREVLAELPSIVKEYAGKEMIHDEDTQGEGEIHGEKLRKMNDVKAEDRIDDDHDDEDEHVDTNDMEVDEMRV